MNDEPPPVARVMARDRDVWRSRNVELTLRRVVLKEDRALISLEARPGAIVGEEKWRSMCQTLVPRVFSGQVGPFDPEESFSLTWRDRAGDRSARVTDVTSGAGGSAIEATVPAPSTEGAELLIDWPAAGVRRLVVRLDESGGE